LASFLFSLLPLLQRSHAALTTELPTRRLPRTALWLPSPVAVGSEGENTNETLLDPPLVLFTFALLTLASAVKASALKVLLLIALLSLLIRARATKARVRAEGGRRPRKKLVRLTAGPAAHA